MAGKLDWCLLRGMRVLHKQMGNDDFAASDHKWLLVEVELLK
jgi:endonuclease/exonuclease/phosphatase (EEP) superfamily protein YafD